MQLSPFVYTQAAKPPGFFNRRREVRQLIGRLAKGESSAIVGQPHSGKTSLLAYLLTAEAQQVLKQISPKQHVFTFLDSQAFSQQLDQTGFWQVALQPLAAAFPDGDIAARLALSRANQFGTFTLEQLLKGLEAASVRCILLLDEFDALLHHARLNQAEFYGSLRALASLFDSLALVITTRRGISVLNTETQAINPHTSPYFNIFVEMQLGPLPHEDARALLQQAGDQFNREDRRFILEVSGRHPYLTQLAADSLWEVIEDGQRGEARYQSAMNDIFALSNPHFADVWGAWTNAERIAITAIALNHIPDLVEEHSFDATALLETIRDYGAEAQRLQRAGVIGQDNGQWRITQQALLWWLADEIKRAIREEENFENWLQRHEYGDLLTGAERQKLSGTARRVAGFLSKGAQTLMEAFIKSFAEGLGKVASHGS